MKKMNFLVGFGVCLTIGGTVRQVHAMHEVWTETEKVDSSKHFDYPFRDLANSVEKQIAERKDKIILKQRSESSELLLELLKEKITIEQDNNKKALLQAEYDQWASFFNSVKQQQEPMDKEVNSIHVKHLAVYDLLSELLQEKIPAVKNQVRKNRLQEYLYLMPIFINSEKHRRAKIILVKKRAELDCIETLFDEELAKFST